MNQNKSSMGFSGCMLNLLFKIIGSLPLRFLYILSDAFTFLAGRVVGYRRKVIRCNLKESFPEKSTTELLKIERDFYRFLGDYFVETIRMGCMTAKEISRRMRFENAEDIINQMENGKNIVLYLGHYCNWEWISSIPLHFMNVATNVSKFHFGQIYHPLENNASDEAFLRLRERWGSTSIPMNDTLKVMRNWAKEGNPFIVGFISDQVPLYEGVHYFADFLNHETPTYTGAERLARIFDAGVFYCDIRRDRRGYYSCRFVNMTNDPNSLPEFLLTQKYYDLLSESIHRQPPFWLWSHNRWKRTKEEFFRLYGEKVALKRLRHL